jgi:hypothetical protein
MTVYRKSGSGCRTNIFSPLGHACKAAESILRDLGLFVNVHIAVRDKRTIDGVFPVITNEFHYLMYGLFEKITFEC